MTANTYIPSSRGAMSIARRSRDRGREEACKDFVPRLWELDHRTKLGDLDLKRD